MRRCATRGRRAGHEHGPGPCPTPLARIERGHPGPHVHGTGYGLVCLLRERGGGTGPRDAGLRALVDGALRAGRDAGIARVLRGCRYAPAAVAKRQVVSERWAWPRSAPAPFGATAYESQVR